MTERHQKAVDELIRIHEHNPENIALIISGSLATGCARENSDIDLYLVVTDEKFDRIKKENAFFYGTWDPTRFSGIEIDGKIIDMQFLREAVTHGSEPTRASFENAYTIFSHNPEVDDIIKKIPFYPEHEQKKRIEAFYAYVKHYRYIGEDAFRRNNLFLSKHCVMELIFFSGRLVLAHNRILFPCHKSLFKALKKCKEMPERFIEKSYELLENIHPDLMIRYYEHVTDYFKAYDFPDEERIGLILKNEWTWYMKNLTISEW
ncbi:MAG: nucleotidyltransferase domain-containing protein [Spirochaetales bacterium]|nr:nucleotidyltransferase domain-containing protein [Spirochaetales bacterium]